MANRSFNQLNRRLGALARLRNLLPLCKKDHEQKKTEVTENRLSRVTAEIRVLEKRTG